MTKSVCFVLMPFGVKTDLSGRAIDFDIIYQSIFKPAIEAVGLQPIRADEEQSQGFIHKLMYERLLLSEYAIADLTILNANVYYELGVRHAAKPSTTIMTMAGQTGLPFDVAGLRVFPFALDATGRPVDASGTSASLIERLKSCIGHDLVDSPLYQLVDTLHPPPIDRERTDVFRERVAESEEIKARLAAGRIENKSESIEAVEKSLGDISRLEASIVIDLLLSYRAVEAFESMIKVVETMDRSLSQVVLVREQLAFAQNRLGQSRKAEETLKNIIHARGPSSETNGLLGRVYKDRWEKAVHAGDTFSAKSFLKLAIETYLEGFECDWRDFYPGVNAVTLMEVADDPRRHSLIPVVRYAIERRLARKDQVDYWVHASRLELAFLAKYNDSSNEALGDALATVSEKWHLETTARNLRLIADARELRKEVTAALGLALEQLTTRINTWKL
jgi:hypothetical protein